MCITRKLSKAFDAGPVHKFINYRNTKTFDDEQFLNDLANHPWSVIDIFDDASDALDYFLMYLTLSYQLKPATPQKKRRVKRQKQPVWINAEILTAIKKNRDQFRKSKTDTQYALWRNKVKALIRSSKAKLYSDFINNSSNPNLLWQTLHDLTGKSAKACTHFINDEDGSPILDPEVAANTFNNFFTSVHKTLSTETNINNVSKNPDLNNIKDSVKVKLESNPEFSISMVTESFILKELQNLIINKATGIDGISVTYLKFLPQ